MDSPLGSTVRRTTALRVLVELGRGGMGVVYLAAATGEAGFLKLKVVKRLRAELSADPQAVAMFLDEARLAARLHHPGIVQTNEVGFDGRRPFLEMEYLEGQSLDSVRRRARGGGPPIPVPLSVWIVGQVLGALHHAHELPDLDGAPLGLVHRDVSPHNVMLTYDGAVKLLDFGIAKAAGASQETQTGAVKGKATYMAPEQAARRPVDRRADVFAAGVMLWEAATGERFWGDRNDFEIFLGLRDFHPPPAPGDARLAAICARALAAAPDDRYPTAAAMLADIEAYLEAVAPPEPARTLAALLAEGFSADRAALRAEIDARIKSEAWTTAGSGVDVPVIQELLDPGALNEAARGGTRLRQSTEIRWLRGVAAGAIGLAVVASLAVALVSWRSRARARSEAVAAPAAPPAGCTSNAACTRQLGRGAICRHGDGVCAPVETDACKLLAEPGDLDDDRALLVGAMFPLSGPLAQPIGEPSVRALELARKDFVQVARGLPSSDGDAPPRAIVLVRCDDAPDAGAVARHLAVDLELPAVIGFGSSADLIGLAASTLIPRRVLAVASMNSSALITSIPSPAGEPRLVFRTSLSSAGVALPVSLLVDRILEPARRAELGAAPRPLRLALVRRRSASGLAVGDALFAALRLNGKTALDNGAAFREVSVDEPGQADAGASYAAAARELLEFAPDFVVYAGADELTDGVFRPLEQGWRGARRPWYVALNSFAGAGAGFFAWLGHDAGLRRRFLGVAAPASTPVNARFTMRYNQNYAEKVTPNLSPAAPYDALYLVAYAAMAAGSGATRGSDLARGIARLTPPGKGVEVGPTGIFEVATALRAGQNVDLRGAGGPLDFDVQTGESPADYVFVCPGADARGAAEGEVESGLGFSSTERALQGTLRCP